ncbi:hypothetical protein NLA06_02120 [Desulfomicrobium sp. ZS1]|uniref:glycosyltransferase n=1 Tax=Desulfomicrobium sp. ZS1 TaxID=2952228 RepID=UPI0020B1C4B1|nr:glycosyltransferase [Desulfomicrobium sp. ZS1]UTF50706.1 hypothetical protein NLA06_02120 [Desulfomicrobium sp. ZS1]
MRNILINKKILFIAYHFPPDAAVGALRIQKFVKYLPDCGWTPFVLTVHEKYYPIKETNRINDLRSTIVERTAFWRTPFQFLLDLRDKFRFRKTAGGPLTMCITKSLDGTNAIQKMSPVKRLLVSLNWFPDDKLYWFVPAVCKGYRLIKKNDIKLLLVSAPPHSSIILAYCLSVLTDTKLIIDFRDPWVLNSDSSICWFMPNFLKVISKKIHDSIVKRSVKIITTNNTFKEIYIKDNPYLPDNFVHVVQNGFDSSDFPLCKARRQTNKYIISYFVSYYRTKMPSEFLAAFSLFLVNNGLNKNDFLVQFVGVCCEDWLSPVEKVVKDSQLENIVDVVGRVSYKESLSLMCKSDLLVLPAQNSQCQIPAKAYEYLGTGRPILAIAEILTATRVLIETAHAGICVDPSDCDGIREALKCFYDDYLNGLCRYAYDPSVYERRYQTTVLSTILEQINV